MDTKGISIVRDVEKWLRVVSEALSYSNTLLAEEALIAARADLVLLLQVLDPPPHILAP
jgi:hypothetical protein